MTTTPGTFSYVKGAIQMPDRNGAAVGIGDWVRLDDGTLAQIIGVRPREEHEPGRLDKKTGFLDLGHSTFDVLWPGKAGGGIVLDMIDQMNFRGDTQGGRAPVAVEKIEPGPETDGIEAAALDIEIEALRIAQVKIQTRLDKALYRRRELRATGRAE